MSIIMENEHERYIYLHSFHCDLIEAFRVNETIYNKYLRSNMENEILTGDIIIKNVLNRISKERNIFRTYKETDTTLGFAELIGRSRGFISKADICYFIVQYQRKYGPLKFQIENLEKEEIIILNEMIQDMRKIH
jgi:hypothetical protein